MIEGQEQQEPPLTSPSSSLSLEVPPSVDKYEQAGVNATTSNMTADYSTSNDTGKRSLDEDYDNQTAND